MKTANMGGAMRTCVLIVVLVHLQLAAGKPFFGLWCDWLCDDYDDVSTTSTTTTLDDLLDAMFDCDCPPRRRPTPNPAMQQPLNIMIPPSNGMNLTMTNTGTSWLMNFMPWASAPATPAPMAAPVAPTTAAPAAAAAATTPAAAAGNATTAAAG